MFKSLTLAGLAGIDVDELEEALALAPFKPCAEFEPASVGWSGVRDSFVHRAGHHLLLKFTVEKKTIPAAGLKDLLVAKCAEIEAIQKYAPGKKQKAEIKERLIDELLPSILPVRRHYGVWIDLNMQTVAIEGVSPTTLDFIMMALAKVGVTLEAIDGQPQKYMTELVTLGSDAFTLEEFAQLVLPGEKGTVVQYKNTDLTTDEEVNVQIQQLGMEVCKLHMTHKGRVSFVLNSNWQMNKITSNIKPEKVEDVDLFDTTFLLMTADLGAVFEDLIVEMAEETE